MNKKEVEKLLINGDVPNEMYSLQGGVPNEKYCIEENDDGWAVYYSERGTKSNLKQFHNEDEACEYFYAKICKILKL